MIEFEGFNRKEQTEELNRDPQNKEYNCKTEWKIELWMFENIILVSQNPI